jgi:hypothetical protein
VGEVSSAIFEVPVEGNLVTNEFTGAIDVPEFYATVEGQLTDDLCLKNIVPEMKERSINSQFYQSITHVTNLYPISGSLSGQLYTDECIPLKASRNFKRKINISYFE